MLRKLVEIQYERNDHDFARGTFRVRGDIVEVFPSYDEFGLRIGLFGDEIDELVVVRPADRPGASGGTSASPIYPKSHFVTPQRAPRRGHDQHQGRAGRTARRPRAGASRMLEAQRLHQRTMFDLEMMKEIGYCHGIENYSRHLSGRARRRAAADAARLPSGRRDHHRRREPSDGAAGARDVRGRPLAEGSAGRVRIPPAVGAR